MRVIIKAKSLSPEELWAMAGATIVALATGWVMGLGIMWLI